MSSYFKTLLNENTFDIDASNLVLSGLTPNSLLYVDNNGIISDSTLGVNFSFSAPTLSLANLTGFTADNLAEGKTNFYFTDTRARLAISGGSGISYNNSTGLIANSGVLSITGTANQVIRDVSTGNITLSLPQSIAITSNVQFNQLSLGSIASTAGQIYITADTGKNGIIASSPNAWGAVFQNSGASTSASFAGANFAALFSGGNIGVGTTNPYALMHLESSNYGTPLTANSYRLITNGSATFKFMSGIGQNDADSMFLNAKTTIRHYLSNVEILTITSGITTIANNAVINGTTTCNAGLFSYGIDSYSYVAVPITTGYMSFNGASSGSYSIQAKLASGNYPFRFAGSADSSLQRYFEFGNYTLDDSANAWNYRFKINSYSGNLITTGSADFGGDIYTTGSIYIAGTYASAGASYTAAAYTCYGGYSGDASSYNNYALLMRNTGSASTSTGIGLGYGSAGSEILWGNAYTAHEWLIQNSRKMYLTTSGLGIGCTGTNLLSLKNNNYMAWRNFANNAETVGITSTTVDDLQFYVNGTRATILSNGNIGFGISPSYPLHISASSDYTIYTSTTANNSFTHTHTALAPSLSDGRTVLMETGTALSGYNTSYFGHYKVSAGSSSNLLTMGLFGADHLMVISGSGNASIGWGASTVAGVRLSIHDAANTYANPQVRVHSNNDFVKCGLGFDGLWNTDALYFYTAGSSTAKMIIDYYGKVGIGGAPAAPLHVNSTVSYADMSTNPMGGQLILSSTNGGRTYIGEYFTGGVGQATAIQNSDYYSGLDHYGSILLNPRGGWVGIGVNPGSNLHVRGVSSALTDYGTFTIDNSSNQGLTFGYNSSTGYHWMYGRYVGVAAQPININNVFYTGTYSQGIGVQALPTAACITCVSGSQYGAPSSYANYRLLCYDTGSAAGSYGIGIEGGTQWYNAGTYHKWYSSGGQKMLLDGSGNLTVGGNLQVNSTTIIKGIQAGTVAAQGSAGTVTVYYPVAFAGGSTVVVNMTVIYGGIGYQVVALLASAPTTTYFQYNILNGGSSHFEQYAGIHWVAYAI